MSFDKKRARNIRQNSFCSHAIVSLMISERYQIHAFHSCTQAIERVIFGSHCTTINQGRESQQFFLPKRPEIDHEIVNVSQTEHVFWVVYCFVRAQSTYSTMIIVRPTRRKTRKIML